jgi:hypothetical protein
MNILRKRPPGFIGIVFAAGTSYHGKPWLIKRKYCKNYNGNVLQISLRTRTNPTVITKKVPINSTG